MSKKDNSNPDISAKKVANRDITKRAKKRANRMLHQIPKGSQVRRGSQIDIDPEKSQQVNEGSSQIDIDQERKDQSLFLFVLQKWTPKQMRRMPKGKYTSNNRPLKEADHRLACDWVNHLAELEGPDLQYIFDSWARVQSMRNGVRDQERFDFLHKEI